MKLILASQSPRRKELLKLAGYDFEIMLSDVDETISVDWKLNNVPEILAQKKADAVFQQYTIADDAVIVAADTIVILEGKIFNKPKDESEALNMLQALSGKTHTVITGVCIRSGVQVASFTDETKVFFKTLSNEDLEYYIKHYHPFDKAGAYGIQDWIGVRIVKRIEGCYFNVMGLPISRVVDSLKKFGIIGMQKI